VDLRAPIRIFKSDGGLAEESRMAWALLRSGNGARREEVERVKRAEVRRRAGVTMLEIVVVIAIIGILMALAGPNMRQWREDQRVKASARDVADAFQVARAEALRRGDRHLVFFGEDMDGDAIEDVDGNPVIQVVHDDDGDCVIDSGEATRSFPLEAGVSFGSSDANAAHDLDTGNTSNFSTGVTFAQPTSAQPQAYWVMFGADGIPVGLTDACVAGITGTGGGAVYLNNGHRDYAIVLTPVGGVRVSGFEAGAEEWN
jgi:prepilin-type N-terminal cleavage/methylation domain-containing protein